MFLLRLFGGKVLGWLAGAGALMALVGGILVRGIFIGRNRERAKQAAAEKKARDVADDVQNDVGALTPEQRREALKKWSR